MKNIVVKARITATSNKQTDKFRVENPKKTAYLSVIDKEDIKALEKFGLTHYTSKDSETDFFIIKLTDKIKAWLNNEILYELDSSVNDPNFSFVEDLYLQVNIIKSENSGNTFYRLNAINLLPDVTKNEVYNVVKETNPFA